VKKTSEPGPKLTRRPIKARDTRWAAVIARWLTRVGLRPNQISVLSVVFAAVSGGCLALTGPSPANWRIILFLAAAAGIQLRLLCNLFDGMVAVEGGLRTKSGEIYNELPDRLSDTLVLAGAGYAFPAQTWTSQAGWAAAVLALITAYVRTLGAAAGASQHFIGPMAKQQRMFITTLACLATAIGLASGKSIPFMSLALVLVAAGCLVTIVRRTGRIVEELESK
jgi:phosphatidylglycerophosphate synthase